MNNTITEELDYLLNHFWVLKTNNQKMFYQIKNKLKPLREFANQKLGCDIICNNKVIKLEKLPIFADYTYGIRDFDNELDYVLYTTLLLFLEEKGANDQFVLSEFTEYVTNCLATIEGNVKPDWKKYKDRKSLVDIMKYASEEGILKTIDGNIEEYADIDTTEALYENTTLSHFIMRQFKFDVFACSKVEDFLELEKQELDSTAYKRFMAYRGLFFYPNIILDEVEKEVSQYIKNMRPRINEDVKDYLEGEFLLSKNMACISLEGTKDRDLFPNYRKSISDIVLLVHHYLIESNSFIENDKMIMNKLEFQKLITKIQEENSMYFSKNYREMPASKLTNEIIDYMLEYRILKIEKENYVFYPIVFLIHGNYDKEEIKEEEKYENLSLDLEMEENEAL